ncbi:hypothetical protein [Sedimentitalea todarodis]|uniref:DUF4231 domain-containing protein n=1 Tax=Sedimentitalea todarodis TaxID=1631240 RepID=A0ABU3VEA9_9RHOB|nr:hypothetical protein [Sedimentitalea todarodis]MDU9004521.1 hypothetical protein [Sedimentitalea todarodis]
MTDLPSEISQDPRYRRVHDERERHAAEARAAQSLYLLMTRIFVVASAVAAIAGGLVLFGTEASPQEDSPRIVHWLSGGAARTGLIIVQGLGLAAAAGSGYILGRREPGKRWVTARMRAEDGRLLLARRTLEIGHEKGPGAFRQAGDWFVSFLEGQIKYLDTSARRRDRSAMRGLIVAALLVALAALASVLTGFDSKTLVVVLAIFGVAVPALTAAVEKWGEATADSKRAELHDASWSALNTLRDDVPAFQAAVAENDLDAALGFTDRVFAVLRDDHSGFAVTHGNAGGGAPGAG